MAGGPDQGKGTGYLPTHNCLNRLDNAAGGIESRLVGVGRHYRIGVEPAAALLCRLLNLFDVFLPVYLGYFGYRGGAGFNKG